MEAEPEVEEMQAAFVEAGPGDGDLEGGRTGGARQQLGGAGMQALFAVFQREVENVALLGGELAEGEAARGDGEGEAKDQPGFAELGPGGQEGESFGQEVGDDPARGREGFAE